MKKILSLALAAAMTLSLLAGCGSKDSGSSTSSANSGGASSQTTGTHDPVTINFPTASASAPYTPSAPPSPICGILRSIMSAPPARPLPAASRT